jgi:hypothetical protein
VFIRCISRHSPDGQSPLDLIDYAVFVAQVYQNQAQGQDLHTAIIEAVKYCSARKVLAKFLAKHKKEVINLLTLEWNLDEALKVRGAEQSEDGLERGAKKPK